MTWLRTAIRQNLLTQSLRGTERFIKNPTMTYPPGNADCDRRGGQLGPSNHAAASDGTARWYRASLPIHDSSEAFVWTVWVSLGRAHFERASELWHGGASEAQSVEHRKVYRVFGR